MNPDDAAHAALRQAAEWYAVLRSGDAGAPQQESWRRWLAADPAHAAAWDKVEAVGRRFAALPAAPALAALNTPSTTRRGAAKKVLALGAVIAFGGVAARRESRDMLAALGAGERTAIGEIRRLALADGSALWMNTDTALDIDFSQARRRLALYRGEILLQRAAPPAADAPPFAVDVPGGRLTAFAPRFSVLREGAEATLTVFEGEVRLDLASQRASRRVAAGTRLRFGPDGIGAAEPADRLAAAWTRRRLSVEHMRLGDFVALLARYRHGHLGCDAAIADLPLTGSYPLDDVDRILAAVEKTLPVRVRRVLPWWTVLEPAASPA